MSLIQYARGTMYRLLKSELEECLKEGACKKSIEDCFIIAGNYWSELRATVAEYKFQSIEDEIEFFKNVKPLFTSELEYYSLLFHTLLFCPNDVELEKRFWERECGRLEDFKGKNSAFLEYYHSEKKEMDKIYYLRAHEIDLSDSEYDGYDMEPKSRTSHDHLISKWMALERYNDYAQKKLKEVSKLV